VGSSCDLEIGEPAKKRASKKDAASAKEGEYDIHMGGEKTRYPHKRGYQKRNALSPAWRKAVASRGEGDGRRTSSSR